MRPSIAKILKRQIGGFVKELEREVNRPTEPAHKPAADKSQGSEPPPERPEQAE